MNRLKTAVEMMEDLKGVGSMERAGPEEVVRLREIALVEAVRVVGDIVRSGQLGARRASDEVVISALQFINFLTEGKITAASEIPRK